MDLEELKEILSIAKEAMVKSVNSYGPGETLRLLLTYQNEDPILRELLAVFPSIVAMNHLLFGKPIIKIQMTDQTREHMSDIKFPIFIEETNDPNVQGGERIYEAHDERHRKSIQKDWKTGKSG